MKHQNNFLHSANIYLFLGFRFGEGLLQLSLQSQRGLVELVLPYHLTSTAVDGSNLYLKPVEIKVSLYLAARLKREGVLDKELTVLHGAAKIYYGTVYFSVDYGFISHYHAGAAEEPSFDGSVSADVVVQDQVSREAGAQGQTAYFVDIHRLGSNERGTLRCLRLYAGLDIAVIIKKSHNS